MKIDPIHQFNIEPLVTLGHIGKYPIAITNSTVYMFVAVGIIGLLTLATGRQLVPGRMQSIAEISYEFVASTIRSTASRSKGRVFSRRVMVAISRANATNVSGWRGISSSKSAATLNSSPNSASYASSR